MATQRKLTGGGVLTMEEGNGRVHFEVTRPLDGRGLYKVWIYGSGGRMLLGTMIPQGDVLQLSRTLSRNSLSAGGCYPVTGGEVGMAFPFQREKSEEPKGWKKVVGAELQVPDRLLQEEIQSRNFIYKTENTGFSLAYRYKMKEEFPMVPLFCLANYMEIEGGNYLVWYFDENGRPIVGNNF